MVLGRVAALGHDEAEFTQQAAQLVDGSGAFLDQTLTRCKLSNACCSALLTGTKRIPGRATASQMASASLPSFLPPLR